MKDSEEPIKQKKRRKVKCVSSDSDTDEEDVNHLEAFLERTFHRGKGKFKGKLPIICFNCGEVGHIDARCPQKKNHKGGDKYKSKRDDNNKDYRDKGKKSCYIIEEDTMEDYDDHDDEVVYVAMKDESDEDEVIVLITCVNKIDIWIKLIENILCDNAYNV